MPGDTLLEQHVDAAQAPAPVEVAPAFRVRPIMRQGTASSIPATWTRFATQSAVKAVYHDDPVLRVFIVTDRASLSGSNAEPGS
jgi:hypothetical protein